MTSALRYEALVEDFNRKLITQLRGHSADAEYLETWVPEEDPVKSILNMVEAAQSYGQDEIRVCVAEATLDAQQRDQLLALVSALGEARIVPCDQGYEIIVRGMRG